MVIPYLLSVFYLVEYPYQPIKYQLLQVLYTCLGVTNQLLKLTVLQYAFPPK